jgi:hypothetical protein
MKTLSGGTIFLPASLSVETGLTLIFFFPRSAFVFSRRISNAKVVRRAK